MTKQSKNVLIIKSSPGADYSVSNEIADFLVEQLDSKDNDYDFTIRDLAKNPAPIYSSEIYQAFYTAEDQLSEQQREIVRPSLEYIAELQAADIIVFASPMHNFSITTLLKAYIDQICRMGMTFKYHADGPEGLLKNKQALIISTAGGDFLSTSEQHKDFQTPYLKHVLGFIGIDDVTIVAVQKMGFGEEIAKASKQQAKTELKTLAMDVL
jgi:FMN-dependent NADH-azoreductase